jgi:hypothetical protein
MIQGVFGRNSFYANAHVYFAYITARGMVLCIAFARKASAFNQKQVPLLEKQVPLLEKQVLLLEKQVLLPKKQVPLAER